MRNPRLTKLESDLSRIPGVTAARVEGDELPSEIHVVATRQRTPKQIVRDVQSLCAATFQMPIDHRIVSVVQLDESPARVAHPNGGRPVLEKLVVSRETSGAWVSVALKWSDESRTEGRAQSSAGRNGRARAAIAAALEAIEPEVHGRGARVELEQVSIVHLSSGDSVLVQARHHDRNGPIRLSGSATVEDDVATAAVHALLHALNRKLS